MGSLSLRRVRKAYGPAEVLKGIDLDVDAGEFLILVGPSGCGKSTLLNVIAGLDSATSGDIYIGNRRVNDLSPKDRDIAMVFQSYALYPNMTVRRNISFGLAMRKVPLAEQARIVDDVARILQMGHLLDRKPAQLSGGQRQRVAMGRAIARNPTLFLFDEPLSNLDAKLRVEMRTEIKLLHQRVGKTIVYVTHDQIEAMTLGDRIAVMNAGEVQQFGTPHDVYENPVNRFVAGFMGSPAMNFVRVTIVEAGSGVGVQLEIDGKVHLVPVQSAVLRDWRGKAAIMGIRPENIRHKDDFRPSDSHRYVAAARVEVTEPTGPDTLVMVRISGAETVCRIHPSHAKPHGETIDLAFDMSKAMFFDTDTGSRIA